LKAQKAKVKIRKIERKTKRRIRKRIRIRKKRRRLRNLRNKMMKIATMKNMSELRIDKPYLPTTIKAKMMTFKSLTRINQTEALNLMEITMMRMMSH